MVVLSEVRPVTNLCPGVPFKLRPGCVLNCILVAFWLRLGCERAIAFRTEFWICVPIALLLCFLRPAPNV
eukprot:4229028-Alexandrium_andersonii.AAC.1